MKGSRRPFSPVVVSLTSMKFFSRTESDVFYGAIKANDHFYGAEPYNELEQLFSFLPSFCSPMLSERALT
jgi:hypothetical protein